MAPAGEPSSLSMPDFSPILTRLLRLRPYAVELLHPRQDIPLLSWVLLAAGVLTLGGAVLTLSLIHI